jgi:F-type H+-transporting ATPase subunit b
MPSVTLVASRIVEVLVSAEEGVEEVVDLGPNPIAPEIKELLWGGGSFLVLLIIMKFLFPVLRKGMQDRYDKIHGDLEASETLTFDARADLSAYQAQIGEIRRQAGARLDQVRATLETERQARLAEVNAEYSVHRRNARDAAESARRAVRDDMEIAVRDVTTSAVEMILNKPADRSTVERSVAQAMGAEVAR